MRNIPPALFIVTALLGIVAVLQPPKPDYEAEVAAINEAQRQFEATEINANAQNANAQNTNAEKVEKQKVLGSFDEVKKQMQNKQQEQKATDTFKSAMQVVVTIAILAAALFIILAKRYTPTDKHWAYGTIGFIMGFWLKF